GSVAAESEDVMATVSVAETGFQSASTALTVTVNADPSSCALGLPVLPVELPGEAVSPGTRSWSFVKAPALTVIEGEVLAVLLPSVTSVAVTVFEPAVLRVTLKVLVPATSAALSAGEGRVGEEGIARVS